MSDEQQPRKRGRPRKGDGTGNAPDPASASGPDQQPARNDTSASGPAQPVSVSAGARTQPQLIEFDAAPTAKKSASKAPGSKATKKAETNAELVAQTTMLTGAIFAGLSAMRGPHWRLDGSEAQSIGVALADCVNALPTKHAGKAAETLQTFAAPIALVGAITAAVMPRILYETQYKAALELEMKKKAAQENKNVPAVQSQPANANAASPTEADNQLRTPSPDVRAVNPPYVAPR